MRIAFQPSVFVTVIASLVASCAIVSPSPAATPVCLSASSDSDGDGWGWEDHRSCIVSSDSQDVAPNDDTPQIPETRAARASDVIPVCSSSEADADGDGWGWENQQSCLVEGTANDAGTIPPTDSDTDDTDDATVDLNDPADDTDVAYSGQHPVCNSAVSDPDGDGWGFEDFRSCIVVADADADADATDNDSPQDSSNNDPDESPAGNKLEDDTGVIYRQQFSTASEGLYQGDQLNDGWNTPFWHLGFDQGRVSIIRDSAQHGQVMQVTYPAGAYGANGASAFLSDVQFGMGLPKSYNELYLSYDIKFGDDFEFVLGGKLPGLCGSDVNQAPDRGCNTGGGFPTGYDGWSARSMWRVDGAMENYVYHSGQRNFYGDDELWNAKAQPGKWHNIQHRVVMNTVGQNNGILEAWFDGEKVLSVNNFIYRKTDTIGINLFYFSTFFGGNDSSWAPSTDQQILFDNFAISTKPIN